MRSSLLGLCRRRGALYGHPRRRRRCPLFQQLSLFVLLLEDGLEHLGDHVQLAVGVRDLQQKKYIIQSEGASGTKMWLKGAILSDKIPRAVGLINCFLIVPEVYLPCSLLPCFQGMLGESLCTRYFVTL